jgi:hypothetical protein
MLAIFLYRHFYALCPIVSRFVFVARDCRISIREMGVTHVLHDRPAIRIGEHPPDDEIIVCIGLKTYEHLAPREIFVVGASDLLFNPHAALLSTILGGSGSLRVRAVLAGE